MYALSYFGVIEVSAVSKIFNRQFFFLRTVYYSIRVICLHFLFHHLLLYSKGVYDPFIVFYPFSSNYVSLCEVCKSVLSNIAKDLRLNVDPIITLYDKQDAISELWDQEKFWHVHERCWQRRCFTKWCLLSVEWQRGSILGRTRSNGTQAPTVLVPDLHQTQYGLVRGLAFQLFSIQ